MTTGNSYDSLAPYYEAARAEADVRHRIRPLAVDVLHSANEAGAQFADALSADPEISVMPSISVAPPSEGDIRPDSTVAWTVDQYRRGGAAALSILTQGEHFGGRIDDINEAQAACDLPILRKDFISTEYQLHEAKYFGAAAALLIVAGLNDSQLRRLYAEAKHIGLDCLVEVHDEAELERALKIEPKVIGVNNRNLSTLKTNLRTARELVPMIPDGIAKVAESGYSVRNPDHLRELREIGADAVLMGTALMREPDPADALASWLDTSD